MQLAIDAAALATNPSIDTIIVVANDSDFSPLFASLRASGKRVVLCEIGSLVGQAAWLLRAMADDCVTYNQALVNAYGFDRIGALMQLIEQDHGAALRRGLQLSELEHLGHGLIPPLLHVSLGYDRFVAFVADCLDHERYVVKGDKVHLVEAKRVEKPAGAEKPSVRRRRAERETRRSRPACEPAT